MKSRITMVLGSVFLGVLLVACGGGGGGSGSDNGGGGIVDAEPPYVVATNPVVNSTAVETNRAITVTFNEAIKPATITSSTFRVDNTTGGIVAGTVTYESTSRSATFRTGDLTPATTYVATITTAVEDLAGNALSEDYTWQFTTGSASVPGTIDITPPLC
jgi:hypothetical protein